MAEKLDDWPRRIRWSFWADYADGSIWHFDDEEIQVDSTRTRFVQSARDYAKKHNLWCSARQHPDGVAVQFTPKDAP
jgi:hypothetical protein